MLRAVIFAVLLSVVHALPLQAGADKATFSVTVTIVPAEPEDSREADGALLAGRTLVMSESREAPLLSPAPAPRLDTTGGSFEFRPTTE